MHFQGTYQKTLTRFLFTSALVVSLLLCALTGWFIKGKLRSDYEHYLESSTQSLESNSMVAASLIFKSMMQCSTDKDIIRWVNAATLQEFYYYAISSTKRLQETMTNLAVVEYDCAITPLNPKAYKEAMVDMVIKPSASMDSGKFCTIHGITSQEYLEIRDYFLKNDQPLCLPRYDKNTGHLSELLYIMKFKGSGNPFLMFAFIPRETFFPDSMAETFFIYNKNGILAYSDNTEETLENCRAIYDNILLSKSPSYYTRPQKMGDQYLLVSSLGAFQWLLAASYEPESIPPVQLFKFGLMAFAVILVSLAVSYCLVDNLYTPLKQLMESSPLSFSDNKTVNEFEVIRKNMDKISELGTDLRKAMEENDALMSIQSYKELLFAKKVEKDRLTQFEAPDADYCVAIGETMNPADEYSFQAISFQKQTAYDTASLRPDIIYINLDYNRYALILRTSSLDSAKAELTGLLNQLETYQDLSISDHRIVLSDIHRGLSELHTCYQEALKILEFRYLHSKSRLITWQEVSSIDAVTYSYPFQTENRLIQSVLDGKEEAIEIFEQIIRENIAQKNLSNDSTQTLIYAFIGTIARIFQEMKTTPEELWGKPVDYKYLYNHWNDSTIFMQLKHILLDIIDTIRKKEDSRDQVLLNKMLGYIYENYWDDIMLNDLADYLNISPKYCGILFKQLSDNNFKDFLNRYRVEKAKEILRDNPDIKIVDLSAMVGFNSSNSFIRVFSKYEGVTPGTYLNRIQSNR
ncbi:MAG: helix-turn-helix domain-containing protein [Hungatella sp.]|nr:helix-turn-helix domain-containing protein [Hungatella sp.]